RGPMNRPKATKVPATLKATTKIVTSITLPGDSNVKILAIDESYSRSKVAGPLSLASRPPSRSESIVGQLSHPSGADLGLPAARLVRLASRWGLQICDCEDCAQVALLALFEQHPDWSLDDRRIWPWLRHAVYSKAMDLHRQKHRRGLELLGEQAYDVGEGAAPCPPEDLGASQARPPCPALAMTEEILERVTEVNRTIFIEAAREGQDFACIGEGAGLTREEVRKRYDRVRQKVRCAVGPLCGHCCMHCRWRTVANPAARSPGPDLDPGSGRNARGKPPGAGPSALPADSF
ncbi:MAG: sigma-70 family RNA polymerase sigma factor, partial [Isosphaeraceae bacterium]